MRMENTAKTLKLGIFGIIVILVILLALFVWQSGQTPAGQDARDTRDEGTSDAVGTGVLDQLQGGGVIGPPNSAAPTPAPAPPDGNTDAPQAAEGDAAVIIPDARTALREASELELLRRQLEADVEEAMATRELRRKAASSPIGKSRFTFAENTSPPAPPESAALSAPDVPPGADIPPGAGILPGPAPSRVLPPPADATRAAPGPQAASASSGGAQPGTNVEIGYSPHRTAAPLSPYELRKGTVIPGLLNTGIHSESPGVISGTVARDVFDTVTGTHRLIPAGAKVFGTYLSDTEYGQNRLGVVWTHLMFPDGDTILLEGQQASDRAGQAGFADRRKGHFLRILGGNLLFTIIGAAEGTLEQRLEEAVLDAAGGGQEARAGDTTINIGGGGGGSSTDSALRNFNRRQSGLGPTLIIRPGYRFNIVVARDLVLEPR